MQIHRGNRTSVSRSYSLVSLGAIVGVLAAALLLGNSPAQAANGDYVKAGYLTSATGTTEVSTTYGDALYALSYNGQGLVGESAAGGDGVQGYGDGGNGVYGKTDLSTASGVFGETNGSGFGVAGSADNGVGVLAESSSGTALRVNGKAEFKRSGNTVTITYPAKSATVSGVSLTSNSIVFATLQKYLAGVYVVAAVPNPGASSFTIYLNKAPGSSTTPKSVTVGWFIADHCGAC